MFLVLTSTSAVIKEASMKKQCLAEAAAGNEVKDSLRLSSDERTSL